jgi:hypothetical protein
MRIRIHGVDHEIPDVDSFTLDESGVLYDYTGITLDRYFEADAMNPRLHQAWLHILVRRTQPDLAEADVKQLVRDTPHLSIFAPPDRDDAPADGGGGADDRESGRPPTGSNGWPENTDASTTPSGNDGANGGGRSPEPSPPASSGHHPSDDSATSESPRSDASLRGSWTRATT